MPTNSISVLIVDDDRTIALMLKQVVSQLDDKFSSESVWADKGASAREELKKQRFQLVLLDYNMCRMKTVWRCLQLSMPCQLWSVRW